MFVSPDMLLRAACEFGSNVKASPTRRVLAVDDWRWRRGHCYKTILVDLKHNKVVELLPDKNAETLLEWLTRHPGVEIVALDRSIIHAEGTGDGAPDAVQVADRWYSLQHLGKTVERVVNCDHVAVRQAVSEIPAKVLATNSAYILIEQIVIYDRNF